MSISLTWYHVLLGCSGDAEWLKDIRGDRVMVNGLDLQFAHKKIMRVCASCQAVCASKHALSVSWFPLWGKSTRAWEQFRRGPQVVLKRERTACNPGSQVGPQRNPIEHDFYVIIRLLTFCCHPWPRPRQDTTVTNSMSPEHGLPGLARLRQN